MFKVRYFAYMGTTRGAAKNLAKTELLSDAALIAEKAIRDTTIDTINKIDDFGEADRVIVEVIDLDTNKAIFSKTVFQADYTVKITVLTKDTMSVYNAGHFHNCENAYCYCMAGFHSELLEWGHIDIPEDIISLNFTLAKCGKTLESFTFSPLDDDDEEDF